MSRKITAVPIGEKWCRRCINSRKPCHKAEGNWCYRFDPTSPLARKHLRERSGLE
ncbi:MAG: hypothetical protein ABSA11_05375 [Candidatus Bathyarchaeia archaeon]